MANDDLETVVLDGVRVTKRVAKLKSFQYAGVAKLLVDSGDFSSAKISLEKFAQDSGDYDKIGPALQGAYMSKEGIKKASELYSKERSKVRDNCQVQEFMQYLEVSDGYNLLKLSEGDRMIFQLRMEPIKTKTIGEIIKQVDDSIKLIKDARVNPRTYSPSQITNALAVKNSYSELKEVIEALLRHNDSILASKVQQKSLDKASDDLKYIMVGLNP
ncbi:MAG: hypothetical protein AABY03_00965, partial [Nanoarchaeota archaeon]